MLAFYPRKLLKSYSIAKTGIPECYYRFMFRVKFILLKIRFYCELLTGFLKAMSPFLKRGLCMLWLSGTCINSYRTICYSQIGSWPILTSFCMNKVSKNNATIFFLKIKTPLNAFLIQGKKCINYFIINYMSGVQILLFAKKTSALFSFF